MEYYAKLVYLDTGVFRVSVTVWKTNPETRIESLVCAKKFISYFRAKKWAEKKIMKKYFMINSNAFLRQEDVIRKSWSKEK
jgi:hypothetical protein